MERLTERERNKNGSGISKLDVTTVDDSLTKAGRDILTKLADYEDLEEQGLLVRLPDDLPKEVYRITYEYTECSEYGEKNIDCENYNCKCECDSKKKFYIVKNSLRFMLFCNYYDELGKTVSLTREEAEKKLEEMKNGE